MVHDQPRPAKPQCEIYAAPVDQFEPPAPAVTLDLTGPDAVDRQVSEAAQRRREYQRLSRQLDRAVAQVEKADAEVTEKREALASERDDVATLHDISFDRLIADLQGTLEVQMRREIAEANAAYYAVSEAENRREDAVRAMSRIQDRLVALGDVDRGWAEALAEKESLVVAKGAPTSDRLTEITARRGEIQAERTGAAEALAHGRQVVSLLEEAHRLLEGADGWTLVDTLLEGGVVTSSPRQIRMDEASQVLQKADLALDGLHREVGDLVESADDAGDLEVLHGTCQGWFDGDLAEASVAERARVTLEAVEQAQAAVAAVLDELHDLDQSGAAEDDELRAERARILATPASGSAAPHPDQM